MYAHSKESPCAKWQNFGLIILFSTACYCRCCFYTSSILLLKVWNIFLVSHHIVDTSRYQSFGNTKLNQNVQRRKNVLETMNKANATNDVDDGGDSETFRKIIYTPADRRCIICLIYITWMQRDQTRWNDDDDNGNMLAKWNWSDFNEGITFLTRVTTKAAAIPKQAMQTKWWRRCHRKYACVYVCV